MEEFVNEPAAAYENRKYTVEEYLAMENASIEKHEYFQGKIFPLHREVDENGITAMSGAGTKHNLIFTNLFGALFTKLRGSKCTPFGSDMRLNIPEHSL